MVGLNCQKMKLFELFSKELLDKMVDERYVNVQKHPDSDLWLYTYSKSCQIDKMWNECTMNCRGIIVDKDWEIKAYPFEKFFNYEEIEDKTIIPNLPFDAYEKVDGSLGIVYWINDMPHICTKGSFTSEQGIQGEKILYTKYADVIPSMDRNKTYLFEIVYPEDHHCINYHGLNDIILLAVKDYKTGIEDNIETYRNIFNVTKHYDGLTEWKNIRDIFSGDNREGFVVRFSNGFRMKMKYEQYFKIHFLRSSLTDKRIFEFVSDNRLPEFEDVIADLDEENQIYIREKIDKFWDMYHAIEDICLSEYRIDEGWTFVNDKGATEVTKEAAAFYKTCSYPTIMFNMAKGKDYSVSIWDIVKRNLKDNEDEVE